MDKGTLILIADDHGLIRSGLRQVLETGEGFTICEAENGVDALRCIRELKPVIAILDVEMPGMTGFEVARTVHEETLKTHVIFLTMFNDESTFNKAMNIGVRGYVLKENTIREILQCIRVVSEGKHYISPSLSDFLMHRDGKHEADPTAGRGISLLTPAERKVLKLLATMKTNHEIAELLNISVRTVHNHRNNICSKLGLRGAHALLRFAMQNTPSL